MFDRVPAALRDQVPHIERREERDCWVLDGKVVGNLFSRVGVHPSEWGDLRTDGNYDTIQPGAWNPTARLEDYSQDGVDAAVLFPNVAGFAGDPVWYVSNLEARLAAIRSYNDWLVEDFCSADPARLIPLCIVPAWDAELAAAEARRAVEKGHRGVIFSAAMDLFGQKPTFHPYWDPLWATIEGLDVPSCLHQLSQAITRPTVRGQAPPEVSNMLTAWAAWHLVSMAEPLPELLLAGFLDRFPRLRIFLAEVGVGWIPAVLTQTDYMWEKYRYHREPKLKMRPSEYWQRNFAAGFWSEPIHPFLLETLGAHTILWEGDYPHSVATFPDSQSHIQRSLAQVADDKTRAKILAGNAIRLFHLA